ncbi:MAG: hypothetical protein JNL60_14615, partial [Bacteroidia bacterium]|nr:hypothetical protein [Bacteroidia bacterium]
MFSNTQIQQLKKYLLLSAFLLVLLHAFSIFRGYEGDMFCWYEWGKMIFTNGLGSVYRTNTDYLPLSHYFLGIYVAFQSSVEGVVAYIEYFKLIPLIVHFIAGYFVVKLIEKDRDEKHPIRKSLFYLLNIPILYNAIVWGQVDIIFSCLVFISYYCAVNERITLSLVLCIAAVNFKLQAVIFLPVLILMLLPLMRKNYSLKALAKWIFIPLLFQALILLPYLLDGSIDRVWAVVTESFGKYPRISLKAYNIWHLLFPNLRVEDPDTLVFAGITFRNWGLLMFFMTSFLALFPLLKSLYTSLGTRTYITLPVEKTLLIFGLIPLLFFYFNTEMHERYSHPAIIFIIIYGIRTNKPILPFMATWCYFFNLEGALHAFHIDNYGTVIFHPIFLSSLWLLVIIGLFLNLYAIGSGFSITKAHRDTVNTWFRNLKSSVQPLINYVNNVKQWKRYLLLSVVVG